MPHTEEFRELQGSLFAPAFLVEDTGSACVSQDNATCELKVEVRSNLTDVWYATSHSLLHPANMLQGTILQACKFRLLHSNSKRCQYFVQGL